MVLVETRLIFLEDFLVLVLGLGCPGLWWMFSEPDHVSPLCVRRKTNEAWTDRHRNVTRKLVVEGGWVQKRSYHTGWSHEKKFQGRKRKKARRSTGCTTVDIPIIVFLGIIVRLTHHRSERWKLRDLSEDQDNKGPAQKTHWRSRTSSRKNW